MSGLKTASRTYADLDVEKVMVRVSADMRMIADSTRGWDKTKTEDYVHDVEKLAMTDYLDSVDLTLFDGDCEIKAAKFAVSDDASGWVNQRPGNAMWPRVTNPRLRIVLCHKAGYDADAQRQMAPKLRINWTACLEDTSHAALRRGDGRSYASNSFGMQRTDWAA